MGSRLREVAFRILKFPLLVLGWVLWIVVGVPIGIVQWLRGDHCADDADEAALRSAARGLRAQFPAEDTSTIAMDEAAAGWRGGFVSIWRFFYGG